MTLSLDRSLGPIAPTDSDATLAQAATRVLESYRQHQEVRLTIRIKADETAGETVAIPTAAYSLLVEILAQMAEGNAVRILPIKKELTTHEAADILNVSCPYLLKLLESGEITYRKVGTRYLVLTQDVLDYKNRIDTARMLSLEELAAQAQELNMGY